MEWNERAIYTAFVTARNEGSDVVPETWTVVCDTVVMIGRAKSQE